MREKKSGGMLKRSYDEERSNLVSCHRKSSSNTSALLFIRFTQHLVLFFFFSSRC
uniref:Uncharacterized protein n=1 Tax=Ascaris lumbricoides TaxID=6252 RepID=A0A0M3IXW2_ASCLU